MTTYPYRTIDPPGSTYSIAYSINAKGQIVGFYQGSNAQEHGFLDSGGTFATIDPPGSIQTIAYSINAKGQIVGWYFDSSGSGQQGFLDSGGIYTTIDPLGSVGTVVQQAAINDSGQIVGYYNANGTNHGFLATPKKGHEAVLGIDFHLNADAARNQLSQLVQAMASFSPTESGSSPISKIPDDVLGQTDHLAPPH